MRFCPSGAPALAVRVAGAATPRSSCSPRWVLPWRALHHLRRGRTLSAPFASLFFSPFLWVRDFLVLQSGMRRTWPALTRRTPSSGRSSRRSRRYTRTLCVVALVICLLLMFTACFRSCTPIFSVSTGSRTKALFGRTYLWQRLRLICCESKKLLHNWKVGFILVDKLKRSERESLALCSCTNLLMESHDQIFSC